MFYSGRMGIREDGAFIQCNKIIDNVSAFGGVLVINWHDRSLVPERLWDGFYIKLLNKIKSRRVWFGTGSGGVSRYDGQAFTAFTTEDGLAHDRVSSIIQDREGHLWFGTDGGVSRYDGKTWTAFTTQDGLAGNVVSQVLNVLRRQPGAAVGSMIYIGDGFGEDLR